MKHSGKKLGFGANKLGIPVTKPRSE